MNNDAMNPSSRKDNSPPPGTAPHAPDVAFDLAQLRADFGRLSDSVATLVKSQAGSAAGSIRSAVADASDALVGKAADLGQSAVQISNGAQQSLRAASGDLETSIERNPLTAVVIAAGIGVVIGMVTARA